MTDFRALCAELVRLNDHPDTTSTEWSGAIETVRAALAEPEPEGPTDDELLTVAAAALGYGSIKVGQYECEGSAVEAYGSELCEFARAVLARWGTPNLAETRSSPLPIPVSKRLPRPEDCDVKGRCWWTGSQGRSWEFCQGFFNGATHWLPADALPLPSVDAQPRSKRP